MSDIAEEVRRGKAEIATVRDQKRERLKNLDFFCLDNSIRESTVGQLRSHTLENKLIIFEEVKKCGIKDIIVAAFASTTRVDDDFVQYLKDHGEDFSNLYSFSEVSADLKDGVYDTETLPTGLKKNEHFGLRHTIFEVDLATKECAWDTKFTVDDLCQLILKRIEYVKKNIDKDGRCLLNLRDLPLAMETVPERVLSVVKFVAQLPPEKRMFAVMFEDATGEYLPEELESWTRSVRRVMDANGWQSGHFLIHIHQKWDLQTAAQLDCLNAGADGVWASLCEEGGAVGHASSSVTMMNLIRLGNTKILEKYNCVNLRNAARIVTQVTTGRPPHPKQCVYGDQAVDLVFNSLGFGKFNMADFFQVETPNRITTLAAPSMIRDRLINLFGKDPQFTEKVAGKMKEKMLDDLRCGRKEEYMSKAGVSILFDRAGGKLTAAMADAIAGVKVKEPHHRIPIDRSM